jgi:alkaline phosphatase
MIIKNNGHVYEDSLRDLLLLIDLKTAAQPTLAALVDQLKQYEKLTGCSTLRIVISGNRPASSQWHSYPPWIYFDGRPYETYSDTALARVALISDDFTKYSRWNGTGPIFKADRQKIKAAVKIAHKLRKPIRFWASPDTDATWQLLMNLKADYLNTDKIGEISNFLPN